MGSLPSTDKDDKPGPSIFLLHTPLSFYLFLSHGSLSLSLSLSGLYHSVSLFILPFRPLSFSPPALFLPVVHANRGPLFFPPPLSFPSSSSRWINAQKHTHNPSFSRRTRGSGQTVVTWRRRSYLEMHSLSFPVNCTHRHTYIPGSIITFTRTDFSISVILFISPSVWRVVVFGRVQLSVPLLICTFAHVSEDFVIPAS